MSESRCVNKYCRSSAENPKTRKENEFVIEDEPLGCTNVGGKGQQRSCNTGCERIRNGWQTDSIANQTELEVRVPTTQGCLETWLRHVCLGL